MKAFHAILLPLLLSHIYSKLCFNVKANSVSECEGLELLPNDYKCCLHQATYESDITGETVHIKECDGITESEYEDIDLTIDLLEQAFDILGDNVRDVEINCGSKYLVISLLSLVLLLF